VTISWRGCAPRGVPAPSAGRGCLGRPTADRDAACDTAVTRSRYPTPGRWLHPSLGDLDFDLREATIDLPQTAVTVLAAFGNVDVYVPEGVNVDVGGLALFGHRRDWGRDGGHPEAPTVHVRAFSVFGTVDVWRVPHDMRGGYGDIFRQLEERQRQLPS